MWSWDFWKRRSTAGEPAAGTAFTDQKLDATAPLAGGDDWDFLRDRPDFDEAEMASVRSRGNSPRKDSGAAPVEPQRVNQDPAWEEWAAATRRRAPGPDAPLTLEIHTEGSTVTRVITHHALIGRRDPDGNIWPHVDLHPDDAVSRRHAQIWWSEGEYLLRDLGSMNGTSHNGKWLTPDDEVVLQSGDMIQLGERCLMRVKAIGDGQVFPEDRYLMEILSVAKGGGREQAGSGEPLDLLDVALEYGEIAGLVQTPISLEARRRGQETRSLFVHARSRSTVRREAHPGQND